MKAALNIDEIVKKIAKSGGNMVECFGNSKKTGGRLVFGTGITYTVYSPNNEIRHEGDQS